MKRDITIQWIKFIPAAIIITAIAIITSYFVDSDSKQIEAILSMPMSEVPFGYCLIAAWFLLMVSRD